MLKIQVANGEIQIEASGSFKNLLMDLAEIQKRIYDYLPEKCKKDMYAIYTDPKYWNIVFEKDDETAEEGRRMRWIMES